MTWTPLPVVVCLAQKEGKDDKTSQDDTREEQGQDNGVVERKTGYYC
jgi:hypothetical protein